MRLFTLLIISSLSVLAGAAIAPALPQLAEAFAHEADAEVWIRRMLTLPALTAALGGPLVGAILDRFGRRRLLLLCLAVYAAAGTSGLLLPSLWWLLASRALLGFALAGIVTSATTLIADYWEESERGRVLGYQAGFAGFAGVLYLVGSGALADLHWRAVFSVFALAAIALPLAWLHLPEVWRRPPPRSEASDDPDAEFPPLYKVILIDGMALVLMASFFLVPLYIPFQLQKISDIEASRVGMLLASSNLCFAVMAIFYRRISGIFRVSALFAIGFAVLCTGFILIGRATSVGSLLPGLILGGTGLGILMPNLNVWATRGLGLLVRGRVVGGLTTSLYVGQFIAPFLAQPAVARIGLSRTFLFYGLVHGAFSLLFAARAWRRRGAPLTG